MPSKSTQSLRIALCGLMPAKGYSGGRYFTWVLAEGLAAAGHDVTFWTTTRPQLADDFAALPRHHSIRLAISPGFDAPPRGPFDLIIVVPDLGRNNAHYYESLLMARRDRARVILLNYETPNWFNAYSPEHRDLATSGPTIDVARSAELILSISGIGTEYARAFFTDVPDSCLFRHVYPAINSPVADSIGDVSKENQIICLTRFISGNKHKGAGELIQALGPELTGMTLLVVVGMGDVDPALFADLMGRANEMGITIELAQGLNDAEKFRRIKQSRVMIFLSYFEGYGYPPVEAQYCGVPCVAYDLPVLREVSGDNLLYVPAGNHAGLRSAITEALTWPPERCLALRERIMPTARFENFTARTDAIVREVASLSRPPITTVASHRTTRSWRQSATASRGFATRARRVRARVGAIVRSWFSM